MGMLKLKSPQRYLDFLNRATFFEGVVCVFGFTEKCFRVNRDDMNLVPMELLVSKPLIINLESAKGILRQISLLIEKNVVYDALLHCL